MKIVKASYEILDKPDGTEILRKIEMCGRVCYKSEDKISIENNTAEKFVSAIIKNGHESVLEHFSFTVRFIVDRGVSHEIVRHRIASFSQESTRYCNYGNITGECSFIEPCFWVRNCDNYNSWIAAMTFAEQIYLSMIEKGASPQEARSVLPNSLKTELVMTANIREWRHFLKLRSDARAHPQMLEVALPLRSELKRILPVLFDDL